MSVLERLENYKVKEENEPEIKFLDEGDLGLVVNRGLSELYRLKPRNPVTFLGNWLVNEARSEELVSKLKKIQVQKEELIVKHDQKLKETKLKVFYKNQ